MIGTYDFCGHYEWTFEWLRQHGGEECVQEYWAKAIGQDSQDHAWNGIRRGFDGMAEYWGHTLAEENAFYKTVRTATTFRFDIIRCPSKGFLIDNKLEQYHDYCDHCMGWVEPLMTKAGFVVHHEHNHCGQCFWEVQAKSDDTGPTAPGALTRDDVRLGANWKSEKMDVFEHSVRKT